MSDEGVIWSNTVNCIFLWEVVWRWHFLKWRPALVYLIASFAGHQVSLWTSPTIRDAATTVLLSTRNKAQTCAAWTAVRLIRNIWRSTLMHRRTKLIRYLLRPHKLPTFMVLIPQNLATINHQQTTCTYLRINYNHRFLMWKNLRENSWHR